MEKSSQKRYEEWYWAEYEKEQQRQIIETERIKTAMMKYEYQKQLENKRYEEWYWAEYEKEQREKEIIMEQSHRERLI